MKRVLPLLSVRENWRDSPGVDQPGLFMLPQPRGLRPPETLYAPEESAPSRFRTAASGVFGTAPFLNPRNSLNRAACAGLFLRRRRSPALYLLFPVLSQMQAGVEIRSYGVCEIPFRSARGYPVVEVRYPDEGASPVPLDSVSAGLLHGTTFSFKDETTALSLVFADHQAKVRELPFKVSDGELCINPGGSYLGFPGEKIEGLGNASASY